MSYPIYFIGGIRDGDLLNWYEVPPEFHLPFLNSLSIADYREEFDPKDLLLVQIIRYKRIGDTLNYVCIDWYK